MSLDPTLLVRRWPERRPVVLAAAAIGFAAVLSAMLATGDAELGVLYVLPVILAALELGLVGGAAAAAVAAALALAAGGAAAAVAVVAVGAVAGRFSDRMRGAHAREQRLLDSALALGGLTAPERLAQTVAAAALRTPRAVGAEVTLDGAPAVVVGRTGAGARTVAPGRTGADARTVAPGRTGAGARTVARRRTGRHRTATDIVARGAVLGRLVVAHDGPLEPEDRSALELLALQAGLAADNQRLLAQEREAAELEAELRRMHDDLIEQRSGLGRLLDAQEDDRRRLAETLHEELAQVLAAVLMGLRMLRRQGADGPSLDELHAQVVGVLADVRETASALRPSTLAQLGLVPALEAIDRLSVDADGLPEPLPEPLRTGVYRLVEHVVAAAEPGARARLSRSGDELDVVLDVELPSREPVTAASGRVAVLGGTLQAEPLPAGRTRLRARLPLQPAAAAAEPTGSVARTTVLPAADSISS